MDVDQLHDLKSRFSPRRTYSFNPASTTVEVDGAMVRIDEDLIAQKGQDVFEIPVEDFLQDAAVIRSARVSTGRDTKEVTEKADKLVGSLHRGRHETPFEGGVVFRLKITTPICFAQPYFQLMGSHNEFSGRYSIIDGNFYVPPIALENPEVLSVYSDAERDSQEVYRKLLGMDVAREQARLAILYCFYTQFYWTTSLRHILEFLSLEPFDSLPELFWRTRDAIFPKLIEDWTPWTSDKVKECPRVIPTAWHVNDYTHEKLSLLLGKSLRRAQIENVGAVFLIDFYGNESDEELLKIGSLATPNPRRGFGHGGMILLKKVPIFVHRQWVRHRYGAWTEFPVDFDMVVDSSQFCIPKRFRKQVGKSMGYQFEDMNDQENGNVQYQLESLISRSRVRYSRLRNLGLSPEEAAQILPYTFYVYTLWSPPIESLMNFFSLRCDEHAQWETRQFANQIYLWFKELFPWSNEIFLKHLNWGKSPLFPPPQ